MSPNLPYYLGFSYFLGIGPHKFNGLMKYFGDVRAAYRGSSQVLKQLLGIKTAEKFIEFRENFKPFEEWERVHRKNIIILTRKNRLYPKQLLDLEDAPICLYCKGDSKLLNGLQNLISIVGTRTPTSYGLSATKKFSTELGLSGFVIVSGMALGIDTAAHLGALEVKAKTIAVLGCGVDLPHPPSNTDLYNRIIDSGGLVISEFPPGMTVKPGLFIARNRLISGLSRGVLVIEGAKDSGALVTAKCASEQGKEVFAVPAPITSSMSEAPNFLLKQGAKLVTSVEDILEEFNLKITPAKQKKARLGITQDEEKIYNLLLKEPKSVDEIVDDLNLTISTGMNLITGLEMKKIIEKNFEGRYQLRN